MASSFISDRETLGHVDPNAAFWNDDNDLDSDITDELIGFFSDTFEASLFPLDPLFTPDNGTGQISYESEPLPAATFDGGGSNHHYSLPSTPHLHPGGDPGDPAQLNHFQWPKQRRICSDSATAVSAYHPPTATCRGCEFAEADQFAPPPAVDFSRWNLVSVDRKAAAASLQELSAQSVAARVRRKRISEKTHDLGKLIPGGNRMNTAEMFQASYRYVKFLQAQVGVLSLMGSIQLPQQMEQQLEVLVGSVAVQDKLCGEGRCVVPKIMVEAFAKDEEVRSNRLVSRDFDRFIGSIE